MSSVEDLLGIFGHLLINIIHRASNFVGNVKKNREQIENVAASCSKRKADGGAAC